MKRNIFETVIGSIVGGIAFYPLATPLSWIITWSIGDTHHLKNFFLWRWSIFWLILLVGIIIGGILGGYFREKVVLFASFKNVSTSIIFWFTVIFGILGLETGFWVFDSLMPLHTKVPTAIDLLIFSSKFAIVGMVIGSWISFLVILIRLAIIKFHAFFRPKTP